MTLPEPVGFHCSQCGQKAFLFGRETTTPGQKCDECCRGLEAATEPPCPLSAAGVPARYREGWGTPEWISRFGDPPPFFELPGEAVLDLSSIVCWGPTGGGKTGALSILLQSLIDSGATALWIRGQELIQGLRGGMGLDGADASGAETESRRLNRLAQEVDVLFIDDLWAGHAKVGPSRKVEVSPWFLGQLMVILAHRYDHRSLTMVSTMMSPKQLGEVDMSLASRLLDRNSSMVVSLQGKDRRLQP